MVRPTLPPIRRTPLVSLVALLFFLVAVASGIGATGNRKVGCQSTLNRGNAVDRLRTDRRSSRCDTRRHLGGAHSVAGPTRTPSSTAPVIAPADPTPTSTPPVDPPPTSTPPVDPPLAPAPPDLPPASHSIYWGAWIKNSLGEAPWSTSATARFEQHAGKSVSLINWSSPFYLSGDCNGYCTFQVNQFNAVRSHGAIPFFSWNPGPGGGQFTDAQIAAGAQDSYLTSWAQAAKQWGYPLFLRFAWEMNASWFPWGVGNNGTTAANYVAMWRHVHDLFSQVGATNVTWVWCPNIDPNHTRTPLANVYPGNAYVDWTCLDGYNGGNPWTSFSSLFTSNYKTITGNLAPDKPMIIGETGSTESGGSKAHWIADMLAALPTDFPKVRGLLWFDKVESGPGGHSDWPIESSTAATDAFATGIQDPAYVGNTYGSLGTSPIPPP